MITLIVVGTQEETTRQLEKHNLAPLAINPWGGPYLERPYTEVKVFETRANKAAVADWMSDSLADSRVALPGCVVAVTTTGNVM